MKDRDDEVGVEVAHGLDRFSAAELETLKSLVNTVVPADEWAGGWDGGVERLLAGHGDDFLADGLTILQSTVAAADASADALRGQPFAQLSPDDQRSIVEAALEIEEPGGGQPWPGRQVDAAKPFSSLVTITYQGFYAGTREPAGWKMVGYSILPPGVETVDSAPPAGIQQSQLKEHYDVIIVGAGAGGGVAAAELSRRGQSVLLVERAVPMRDVELRGNHLQNKRTAAYDIVAGPHVGNPRVLEHEDGTTEVLRGEGNALRYGVTAMALGGGTRVWQGMAWRFWEQDFHMASIYGSPAGSTLVDWPFDYSELAPWYDRAEWELGVSGDAHSAVGLVHPRTREYPMPAMAGDVVREAWTGAAARLGLKVSPIPFSINSVEREGRAACVRCSQCIGAACPVNAKNGTHNTFIPRAIATGNCDLLMSTQVVAIDHDGRGTATGVRMFTDILGVPTERTVRADRVIVTAGAVETPRLLLASGLGNEWVGRNHHSHGLALALALDAPDIKTFQGPGHSVATIDHMHHNGEAWGGGVLFDFSPPFPAEKADMGRALAGAQFGAAHKRWMRDTPTLPGAMSMVQEVPHEATRVTLDGALKDRLGMPAAHLAGRAHAATVESVEYMIDAGEKWMRELGATRMIRIGGTGSFQGSEHSAGTARMSNDPALGATDARGLLYGTANVYVADASLHPTNGGFNPALTVMANSMRVANLLLD